MPPIDSKSFGLIRSGVMYPRFAVEILGTSRRRPCDMMWLMPTSPQPETKSRFLHRIIEAA